MSLLAEGRGKDIGPSYLLKRLFDCALWQRCSELEKMVLYKRWCRVLKVKC